MIVAALRESIPGRPWSRVSLSLWLTLPLAARAYPTRPALAGALLGLGAGLMADAGWRLFCHFSEPAHVLSAHLGAVVIATLLGSALATAICRAQRRSWARCLSRPSSGRR